MEDENRKTIEPLMLTPVFADELNETGDTLRRVGQQVTEAMKPLQLFSKDFAEQCRKLSDPLIRFQQIAQEIGKSFWKVSNLFSRIDFEGWEKFEQKFGWIEFLSLGYALGLKDKFRQRGDKEVWNQLISDFRNTTSLKEYILKSIEQNKLVNRRKQILARAFEHHTNGDFVSSIPLLLSQIEGILWDMGVQQGIIENEYNSRNLLDGSGNLILKNGKPVGCVLEELTRRLFDPNSRFGEQVRGEVYTRHFRHPVLHGRKVDYANEEHSTMLILMVWVLLEKNKSL